MLDIATVPIFLVGGNAGLLPRLDVFLEHGATQLHVFVAAPDAAMRARAGARLHSRWPDAAEFASLRPRLIFVADVDDELASRWRELAHMTGAFVHVQDRIPLCDFHMPAILRRGHLQVTVSTDGVAPGVARILRDHLAAKIFGAAWEGRVNELRAARDKWRGEGLSVSKLGAAIADFIRDRGWL